MSKILEQDKSGSSSSSRKRKRSPEDEAKEKVDSKRIKLGEWYGDLVEKAWTEDPENLSSKLEDKTINDINSVLVEQEKIFLRKDPYGSNFLAATWSNESTLLRKDALPQNFALRQGYLQFSAFPEDIFAEILSYCDPSALAAMLNASISMNKMMSENQPLWCKLFYRRHWRLKHDIENNFVGTDPEKSNWSNIIPINEVDWFGEYKRNHVNAKIIKNTIEEIKSKLQRFVNAFAEVKEGVTNPLFFEPGVTDEEIDDRIVMDGIPITNDLRELLKCCNGARFFFTEAAEYLHDRLRILFPSLQKLSAGPYTWKDFLYSDSNCRSFSYLVRSSEQYLEVDGDLREIRTSAPTPMLAFDESDMSSDSEEYSPSNEVTEDDDEDAIMNEILHNLDQDQGLNDKLILFNIDKLRTFPSDIPQQIYCPQTGSIDHFDHIEDSPEDSFSSIVDYLQLVSDYLDCGHSVKWVKFDDYVVGDWDDEETDLVGINDPWLFGPGQTLTAFIWEALLTEEIIRQNYGSRTVIPRASKILYAAAQDFLIKVFAKAWSLETTDTLQPDTLIEAANQMSSTFDRNFQRVANDEELDDYDDVDIGDDQPSLHKLISY